MSNQHVLTAANCLNDFTKNHTISDFNDYSVELGVFYWNVKGVSHMIKEMEIHGNYNPFLPNPSQDIGMITVNHEYINH